MWSKESRALLAKGRDNTIALAVLLALTSTVASATPAIASGVQAAPASPPEDSQLQSEAGAVDASSVAGKKTAPDPIVTLPDVGVAAPAKGARGTDAATEKKRLEVASSPKSASAPAHAEAKKADPAKDPKTPNQGGLVIARFIAQIAAGLGFVAAMIWSILKLEEQSGEIKIESHWGGFGGDLGGWTVSRSAMYLMFALLAGLIASVLFVGLPSGLVLIS